MDILNQYPEYRHAIEIWKTVPPILIVLGTLGNLLTIIVLMKSKSRLSSTALYLTALAISDLLVLWAGLLRQWINYTFDIDVRLFSEAGCKIHVFLVYFATQCSSWLLVAVTSERVIGVWLPHKVKQGCTTRVATTTISVIVACLMLLNGHYLIGMELETEQYDNVTDIVYCYGVYDNYYDFIVFKWPWIDISVFSLVPFVILFVGNISIITRVLIRKHKTRRQIAPHNVRKADDDKTSQLTVMLLMLNLVFFICNSPISIYHICESTWIGEDETDHDIAVRDLWWAVVNSFMYLNNTLNFVLYFLSGSRFRNELKSLFLGRQGRWPARTTTTRAGTFSNTRRPERFPKIAQTYNRPPTNMPVLPNVDITSTV